MNYREQQSRDAGSLVKRERSMMRIHSTPPAIGIRPMTIDDNDMGLHRGMPRDTSMQFMRLAAYPEERMGWNPIPKTGVYPYGQTSFNGFAGWDDIVDSLADITKVAAPIVTAYMGYQAAKTGLELQKEQLEANIANKPKTDLFSAGVLQRQLAAAKQQAVGFVSEVPSWIWVGGIALVAIGGIWFLVSSTSKRRRKK